ncbi:MAG: hypothetical protein H0U04_01635 [Rubrobacter sp.]|nr:hypothetical protein [Rubrobacter sp.]
MAQAAAYFLLLDGNANVVLAGDHRQLGPIYGFQVEDTEEGLFECVFTDMQDAHRVTPTALDTNYRTNDEIAAWPRERFYPEGYEAVRPGRRLSLTLSEPAGGVPEDWPELVPWGEELATILDPSLPVAVVTYPERPYTLSNPFEAQTVAALTLLYRRSLEAEHGPLSKEDLWSERLGIVTPHRAQMSSPQYPGERGGVGAYLSTFRGHGGPLPWPGEGPYHRELHGRRPRFRGLGGGFHPRPTPLQPHPHEGPQ